MNTTVSQGTSFQLNLISFFGIAFFIGLAWVFSNNKRKIKWRIVFIGVGLQFAVALFIFIIPVGIKIITFINNLVVAVVDASTAGSDFVFGSLAIPPGKEGTHGFIFAFQSLPTIIFFSSLLSLLYYFNVMPRIIRAFALLFCKILSLSGAESVSVASNIFVGVESAFTIRPHLNTMTRSELCTILTAGMATVASNVLALYVFTLRDVFPMIAGHLVSASLLSAPAAVVMSKIMIPEDAVPETLGVSVHPHYERESNFFEAIINGAQAGVKVIVGVGALLIAVLGLIALLDSILGVIGNGFNNLFHTSFNWSFKGILGYLFYPFSFIMGVHPHDAKVVAEIIGERTIMTEVTSYQHLAAAIASGLITNPRSIIITTYALCGFAHFASMAIFIGGMSALAPGKTKMLSRIGLQALCAATFACMMTACVAGVFAINTSILIGS